MHIIRAAGYAALILLILLVGVLGGQLLNPEPAPERPPVPPCATEDAAGPCVWDASTQGNGRGRSFWVDAAGVVHYLTLPSPITR